MSTFKVGEVVILQNARVHHELNGKETCVTAVFVVGGETFYEIDETNALGLRLWALRNQLRKKRPPTTGEESILALFRRNQREGVAA